MAMNLFGCSADRHRERRRHLIVPSLMGAVGFSPAASWTGSTALSLIALSVAAAGVLDAIEKGDAKAARIAAHHHLNQAAPRLQKAGPEFWNEAEDLDVDLDATP
ncbi:hypothetical protein [Streptomyces sp. NPDC058228]|uniref:hypothetical protein n=1 Tax=Streptomyces sp. NPDC058228 TaxID=3346390 RepID=UPI0036E42826